MDFAKRAYDHSYHIDPIVRSLLDTDFYKLLMLQFIWKNYYGTQVTLRVDGEDEQAAMDACAALFERKFDEGG